MIHLFIADLGFFGVLMLLLGLGYLVFWVYTLVDIINGQFRDPSMKVVWIVVVIFAQFIGPIIYWLISRSQKI
jgi:uncharacterized Tic20 family protein